MVDIAPGSNPEEESALMAAVMAAVDAYLEQEKTGSTRHGNLKKRWRGALTSEIIQGNPWRNLLWLSRSL